MDDLKIKFPQQSTIVDVATGAQHVVVSAPPNVVMAPDFATPGYIITSALPIRPNVPRPWIAISQAEAEHRFDLLKPFPG
jgi:hypothetical protein